MSKQIYKYDIFPDSWKSREYPISIDAPRGAIPVHIDVQGGGVKLWAEVDTDQPIEKQTVLICVGTGHGVIPEFGYRHFQSIQAPPYVWHFYKLVSR